MCIRDRYSVSQNCPVEEVYTNAFAEAQEAMDYLHQNAGDLHIDPEQMCIRDSVMGARTVVEAVAIAKQVAESMDKYMKSLPADTTPDPYADIPTFQTPTSDVLGKQEVK